jgi:hypothetical protein
MVLDGILNYKKFVIYGNYVCVHYYVRWYGFEFVLREISENRDFYNISILLTEDMKEYFNLKYI